MTPVTYGIQPCKRIWGKQRLNYFCRARCSLGQHQLVLNWPKIKCFSLVQQSQAFWFVLPNNEFFFFFNFFPIEGPNFEWFGQCQDFGTYFLLFNVRSTASPPLQACRQGPGQFSCVWGRKPTEMLHCNKLFLQIMRPLVYT